MKKNLSNYNTNMILMKAVFIIELSKKNDYKEKILHIYINTLLVS